MGADGIKGSPHTNMLKDLVGTKVYIVDGVEYSIGSTLIICEAMSSTTCYLRKVVITAQCSGTGVYTPFHLKNIQNVGTIHKDEDLRTVAHCVLAWELNRAGLKLLSRPTHGGQKNIVISCMLSDGRPFLLDGHLDNGADGLHDHEGYVVPKTVDLEAVPAVSYVKGASNTVVVRLLVTRIGGPFLLSSNRSIFMQFASKTIDSPSMQLSALNSQKSLANCYVKVDRSDGSTVVRLNQTQMRQSSMAKQLENRFRATFGDEAPVLPYCGSGLRETPSLLLRCVSEAIVQEIAGMVSDAGRLGGGDSATGKYDFALELLRAVGPGGGALMVPAPCLFKNAPALPYRPLAQLGPPSQTRKAAVTEAIAALGGETRFLLAVNKSKSKATPDWQFDTSGEGGFPWTLVSFASTTGRFEFIFKTRRKTKQVPVKKLEGTDAIDVANLDLKIALAGAPNRGKTFRSQTTYKRRGPASPIILPIYRDLI